jgi:hypothetical protein
LVQVEHKHSIGSQQQVAEVQIAVNTPGGMQRGDALGRQKKYPSPFSMVRNSPLNPLSQVSPTRDIAGQNPSSVDGSPDPLIAQSQHFRG